MQNLFVWPPPKRRIKLTVVIPCSILAVEHSLYEKTIISGFLARALAIFRVDDVVIFVDNDCNEGDADIIADIMNYMLTPPYMRKKLVGKVRTLKYAGMLPPLNIPTHPASDEGLDLMPVREGVICGVRGRYAKVDVGLKDCVVVEIPKCKAEEMGLGVGRRVLVKVVGKEPLKGVLVSEHDVPWYLGFKVSVTSRMSAIIRMLSNPKVVGVMTTKHGGSASKILELCGGGVEGLILLFGNYRKDFDELVEGGTLHTLRNIVKVSVNAIPLQGVRSVRTVEAVYATLAVINELLHDVEIGESAKIYK